MKITYKGSLQRAMLIYFLLITFASSLIVTEFIIDIQRKEFRYELMQNFERLYQNQINPEDAFHPIERIRNKAILMVGLLLMGNTVNELSSNLQEIILLSKDVCDTADLLARRFQNC